MYDSDDEEENEDWDKPVDPGLSEVAKNESEAGSLVCHPKTMTSCDGLDHSRVVLHIDIDCFYAQVEMIRNPALRNKPLGIQQKYIVVTCNYPAREFGVTKLMRISDAKEKCPNLVLVSGEDLTHYREMSYKISNYLQKYCPLVERLGFDENFLDITDLVNDRISASTHTKEVKGYVYNQEDVKGQCRCGCHERLTVGSQISADIRDGLNSELGITCCGGVAVNKLLSKLVAGKHKPNQQTTLFPEQTGKLMLELNNVRQIPGIGHTTGRRLREIGITTVQELQNVDKTTLEDEFGITPAENMKNLCFGIDESPVIAFGLPQSLSDEDSFKKCSSVVDVKSKLKQLITSLLGRLLTDCRTPHTFRLTVRKLSAANKYLNKESRQCPLSTTLFRKFSADSLPHVCSQLETHAYSLFVKLVDTKLPFHITLLNVAFTKLEQKSSNSIAKFFSPNKSPPQSACNDSTCKSLQQCSTSTMFTKTPTESLNMESSTVIDNVTKAAPCLNNDMSMESICEGENSKSTDKQNGNSGLSAGELSHRGKSALLKWFGKSANKEDDTAMTKFKDDMKNNGARVEVNAVGLKRKSTDSADMNFKRLKAEIQTEVIEGTSRQFDGFIPDNVDKSVFLQLPADIQKEILNNTIQEHKDETQVNTAVTSGSDKIMTTEKFDIHSSLSQCATHMNYKPSSSFFSNINKGKSKANASISSKMSTDKDKSLDSNSNLVTSKIRDADQLSPKKYGEQTVNDSLSDNIPPHIDKTVFETLPAEIQTELIEDWKRKLKQDHYMGQSPICVKSPSPSSGTSIMSYFPKANKK